ncbi:MAG: ABC transporter permease [Chthonomonadales bacterium]
MTRIPSLGRAVQILAYYVHVYRVFIRTALALMAQYRFSVLIWAVWGFVGPLISLAVWAAATSARGGAISNKSHTATFAQGDFAGYFLVFMIIGHLTMSWDAFEFAWRVRTGELSPRLLRPIHPIHGDIAVNIGFKLVTSAMLLPFWIALFVMLKPTLPHPDWRMLALPFAVVLAGLLRYVWQYALAVIAFWTTRVDAINQLFFTLDSFLSGRIAPLALLPGWLGAAAAWSPFSGMGSFPVMLALGRVPGDQVLAGLAMQGVWIAAGVLLLRVLWSAGVRQYSAVGA